MKLKTISSILGLVVAIMTIILLLFENKSLRGSLDSKELEVLNARNKMSDMELLITELNVKIESLKFKNDEQASIIMDKEKYIENNSIIPEPGLLEEQLISKSVADRYFLVYVQLIMLAKTAKAPRSNLNWLSKASRKGVLHNVLEKYSLIAIDTTTSVPEIAAKLTVEIDWEACELYGNLKSENRNSIDIIHRQPTMGLAATFSSIVEREKLDVEMRCRTVQNPNYNALNALGIPKYEILGNDTIYNIDSEEFCGVVDSELNLIKAKKIKWRKGRKKEELKYESLLTPELTVKLEYMHPALDSLSDKPK